MPRLNQSNLDEATLGSQSFEIPLYNRKEVRAGIVHFGVGNFHRCHQAIYSHHLLNQGHLDWGITGVSLRSSDTKDQLAPQDFLYTEATLSEEMQLRVIGSLLNILVAPENPEAVITQVADVQTKLITTTITEKGYYLNSGSIDWNHEDLETEIQSLEQPQTIYGYLAAALIVRHTMLGAPLSILCCDNIQGGGKHLQAGVQKLLEIHDESCAVWAKDCVSFSSSMVDRVAPKTDEKLKTLVLNTTGLEDAWPVSAEPFTQWVIEDNFAAQRPPFHEVGAVLTEDISLFEQMKLRFLNASHSIISSLGYLHGKESIHEALEDQNILEFVTKTLRETVLPVTTIPPGFNGEKYIADILDRFKNSALPYSVQQVNTDCSQKIQQRWFPTIEATYAKNGDFSLMSFALAAWALYIEKALQNNELNDPLKDDFLAVVSQQFDTDKLLQQFFALVGASQFDFFAFPAFTDATKKNYETMKTVGCEAALDQFLNMKKAEKNTNV